ncbi:MAG: hypothetical protein SFV51_01425 [Bryobacteraceae bacterium]|nr:hypothetical protein [Bryobacteraceae bacterium]
MARWRLALGLAILAALAGFCLLLFQPYLQNWRFQTFLETVAFEEGRASQPEAVIQSDVVNQAARLGLPVTSSQVRVSRNAQGGVFLEVRYFVRVDLPLYTVDLHFRPSAGVR